MTPFFSIIIPVYNVAPYLRECLDSVLAQTFTDWEAICVDDGSTDGSGAILDEYAARDRRFRIIHQHNAGVSAARNKGLEISSGEYITFIDGDDAFLPKWLDVFARTIRETNADLVRQKSVEWNGEKAELLSGLVDWGYRIVDDVMSWGVETYASEGFSWLNAIRKSCLMDKVLFPTGMRYMEDNIFMLNVVSVVNVAVQTAYLGYLYRKRDSSVCGSPLKAAMIRRLYTEAIPILLYWSAYCYVVPIGRMLINSALTWRRCRNVDEVGGAAIIRYCIKDLFKTGVFGLGHVPFRWRLGFWSLCFLDSWVFLDLLLYVQDLWGNLLKLTRNCRLKVKSSGGNSNATSAALTIKRYIDKRKRDEKCLRFYCKPKVLVFFTEFTSTIGGSEYLAFTVIQELLKLGCKVTLATREICNAEQAMSQYGIDVDFSKVNTVSLAGIFGASKRLNRLFDFVWLRKLRKLGPKFDVCISCANPVDFGRCGHHFIYMMTFDREFRAWVNGDAKVESRQSRIDIHAIKSVVSRWLAGVRTAADIVKDHHESVYPNSEYVKTCIEDFFRCKVKATFYPPTIFEPINGGAIRNDIAYVGRISREKCVVELIQVVAKVRELTGVDIRFRIAGHIESNVYTDNIRCLAGENKWISLEGAKIGRDKAIFLSECKFALHGRRDEEFGISVTEYLKAGLVPVVPNVGGASEVVGNKVLCYDTYEDACIILERLICNKDFYCQCKNYCAIRAQEFNVDSYFRRQEALIRKIVLHG